MLKNPIETASLDKWIGNINKICGPFSAKPVGSFFSGSVEKVGGVLDMSRVNIEGADLHRTSENIRECTTTDFFCIFQTQGCSFFDQTGNRSALTAGDIVLIDSAVPFSFSFQNSSQQLSLILPRSTVERIMNLRKIEPSVKIPAHSHIASFASKLVLEASKHKNLNNEESSAILDSLATLIKPSILRTAYSLDPYDRVFITASEFIKENISNPELNASMISKSAGVSLRGLYRAFSYKEITLSEHIKKQRLDMCADYIKAQKGRLYLTEIAYKFGFSNPSYFSTVFKNHYNMTPSEYIKSCS